MKILFLLLFSLTINSQNLVPNPSFELYSSCSISFGQINRANSWNSPLNTDNGSPDYFNPCASENLVRVPSNLFGYQNAFEGNAYVGLVTYYSDSIENFREYIQTQLISPLIAGQQYNISYYVSAGDVFQLGSNNLNAILTTQPVVGNGTNQPINQTPQIINSTITTSNTDWTLISGTYIAQGNERYLTIGNFANDSSTQTIQINPNAATNYQNKAYYYIDNVSVVQNQMNNEEFLSKNISVTPNPIIDTFSIILPENSIITSIELYSQYNKIKVFNCNDNNFQMNDMPSGIYYLIVTLDKDKKIISKVLKL